MFRMTAATRITLGLVCSMLGILMAANFLDLLPDAEGLVTANRAQMTESLAFTSAPLIEAGDVKKLQAILDALVHRNHEMLSAGIRKPDGTLRVSAGTHADHWPVDLGDRSTERFMQVTLSAQNQDQWGRLEVVFTPLRPDGLLGQFRTRMTQLLFFCAPVAFFSFRWFLTMVLKNLDPTHAVPRRVREALDILSEGLMIVGVNSRVLLANKAMEVMTGREENKLIGVQASSLGFRPLESANSGSMPWETALAADKGTSNVMMVLDSDDGPARIFRVNCSSLVGNDGEIRGVMVTFDDVTILEENKLQLRDARDEAEAANKAKSDFLANMSHEIRNPMNAIVGFTDILRRGMEDSEATRREYLNTIHASGNHLVGLINDILDLSKIESGKMEMEICECSPWQLMGEVVNVLKMKAEGQNLTLEHSIQDTIPRTIHSDPTRLRQVLMNLVGNAIKFTESGSVRIVAEQAQADGRSQIRFSVIDTGIGMTKEQCAKVFEEFVQADTSVTRRFGGTGLGLAISKRLTEALGGEINLASVPGEGTEFTFTVDTGDISGVELIDAETAQQSFTDSVQTQQATVLAVRFKPARVLVTDDTPANRQLVGLVLRKSGLIVEEAEHGLQAFERATSEDFDLLLMDMQMPVMDGFTATKKLREHGITVPIFALTANVMQADRERCEAAGCTGFLTKPIDIDRLLTALAEILPIDDSEPVAERLTDTAQPAVVPSPRDDAPAATPICTTHLTKSAEQIDEVMKLVDRALGSTSSSSPVNQVRRIRSTLPTDIPEFRQIVQQFVQGLPAVLREMRDARDSGNFNELRELAHKLKGTGGTVGFADFTAPAERLQQAAETHADDAVDAALRELEQLSVAIDVSDTTTCEHVVGV